MTRDYSHRLGKKKVKFVRKDGTPVTGKEIEVKMYCHEFLFGTGLFDVIPYVCGEMKPEEEEAFEKIFRKWIDRSERRGWREEHPGEHKRCGKENKKIF